MMFSSSSASLSSFARSCDIYWSSVQMLREHVKSAEAIKRFQTDGHPCRGDHLSGDREGLRALSSCSYGVLWYLTKMVFAITGFPSRERGRKRIPVKGMSKLSSVPPPDKSFLMRAAIYRIAWLLHRIFLIITYTNKILRHQSRSSTRELNHGCLYVYAEQCRALSFSHSDQNMQLF
jgi:hypothetical protein